MTILGALIIIGTAAVIVALIWLIYLNDMKKERKRWEERNPEMKKYLEEREKEKKEEKEKQT